MRLAGAPASGGELDDSTQSPPHAALLSAAAERDRRYMRLALAAAEEARAAGEVPVGAVIVRGDEVIARGFNHPIGGPDPSAHPELAALPPAPRPEPNSRLPRGELDATPLPSPLSTGATLNARTPGLMRGPASRPNAARLRPRRAPGVR
ncbi:hypothetical protein DIS09_30425, partial [Burkholderia pseudomallei]